MWVNRRTGPDPAQFIQIKIKIFWSPLINENPFAHILMEDPIGSIIEITPKPT